MVHSLVDEKKKLPNKTQFNMATYNRVAQVINQAMDERLDCTQVGRLTGVKVQNKKFVFNKNFYQPLRKLLKHTGWCTWDPETLRPIVDEEQWQQYIKGWVSERKPTTS